MATALESAIKAINKQYNFDIVGKADIKKKDYCKIPLKSPAMTYLFRGGMPRTIVELCGMPSAAKSTFCYSVCGEAQKVLKREWEQEIEQLEAIEKPKTADTERLEYLKERGPQRVVYLDSEFSSMEDWMVLNGIDMDELLFIAPENQTAEQLFQILIDLIATDGVGCCILDSIPALVSQQAMGKTMEEKTMAGISAPLSTFCSKLLPLCNKHNCLFIGVNQVREDLSGYHQVITPGGKMWKHTCNIRLLFRKGKYYDSNYKELTAHPEEAYGNYSEVEVLKNKCTKPDRKLCKFSITYNCGIDGVNDTFNMGVALGVLDKAGAWYSYKDEDGNIKEDSEGNLLKWQGKAGAMEYLREHKDIYDEIYNAVCKAVESE